MRSLPRIALVLCALAMVDCVETPSEANTTADPPRRATRPVWIDKPAAPITISVRDLDVHEFARRLTSMTGVPIVVFPSATGKVTIDVKRMPWDAALATAIAPLGLRYDLVAEKIVIRPDQRSGVIQAEPPPGYYRVGGDIKPPKVLTRVEPDYPEGAKKARISGVVIVEARIGDDGTVRGATVLKGLPYGLDQAAVDAVRQWVFQPATYRDKAVPVVYNVIVRFDLHKKTK